MYYLKIMNEDANSLIYYCRNCGHENNELTAENVCVSDVNIKHSEQQYVHIVNEFTKYDPTLPRINTINCPNSKCESNDDGKGKSKGKSEGDLEGKGNEKVESEVIYIRYDDTNMKYVYVCAICNTTWKNDK
jgi:hypothetical protein